MTEERKERPMPPPRGLIKIAGEWQIRRFGLLVQRQLTCIYGHRIIVGGRPFEIAIPCLYQAEKGQQARAACQAYLYIFTTRARLLWAMDVTIDESMTIDQHSMDVEEIISHFGVGFPVDMKIARL